MSPRRLSVAVIALATTVLLAGCGDAQPGVAVRVGDREVSTRTVDAMTTAYCDAVAEVGAAPVSLRSVQEQMVGAVAVRTAMEEFAAPYDVEPGADYQRAVTAKRAQLPDLDADAADAIMTLATIEDYLPAMATAVAEQQGAKPGRKAEQAGQQLFAAWLEEHPVVLNPRYGLELDGGQMRRADPALSVPVSAVARQDQQGGSADVASLPPAQRCG